MAIAGCATDPAAAKLEHVENGDRYLAQQRYPEAILEYRGAIQQDFRFTDARVKLAEVYTRVGDLANALGEYVRAADTAPHDAKLQIKAGNLLLLARQFDNAQARADRALKISPNNVEALILRACALAGLRKLDDALHEAEEAVRADTTRPAAHAVVGSMQLLRGDPDKAEEAFRNAVAADPRSIEARLALASFYWATRQLANVEVQLRAALDINRRDQVVNRALAWLLVSTGRAPEAEAYLKVVADETSDGSGKLTLAEYYLSIARPKDARAILTAMAKPGSPHYAAATLRLASIARFDGDHAAAERLVDTILAAAPRNTDALIMKVGLLGARGKLDEALRVAAMATETSPQSGGAQFVLGRIHLARGGFREAAVAFTRAARLNPQLAAADVELAQLHLAVGDPVRAEAFAQNALTKAPNSHDSQLVTARIALALGHAARAKALLGPLQARFPESAEIHTEIGRVALAQKQTSAARSAFQRALAANPRELTALQALIKLEIEAKRPAEATRLWEAAAPGLLKDGRFLVIGAQMYTRLRDFARVERLLRRAIEVDPARGEAFAMLGSLYLSRGMSDQALREFQLLAARQPRSVGAHTVIGTIHHSQNRRDAAKDAYRKALAVDPNAAISANNLAWMYMEENDTTQALSLAQTAKARLPESADVADTLGWILLKRGLIDSAVPQLKEAVAAEPANAMFQYHLGAAYAKKGETVAARRALESSLKLAPRGPHIADARALLSSLGRGSGS